MQSRWARIGILAGAVVVIVLLFVVLGGDGSDDSATQAVTTEEPTGDIDGLFEAEFEGSHLQIAELRVQP